MRARRSGRRRTARRSGRSAAPGWDAARPAAAPRPAATSPAVIFGRADGPSRIRISSRAAYPDAPTIATPVFIAHACLAFVWFGSECATLSAAPMPPGIQTRATRPSRSPAPSATSRASYSDRNVQRPGTREPRHAASPLAAIVRNAGRDLAGNSPCPSRPIQPRLPLRVGKLRHDHPGRALRLNGDRPFLGSRRFGRQRLCLVEGCQDDRGRPSQSSSMARASMAIALEGTRPRRGSAPRGARS